MIYGIDDSYKNLLLGSNSILNSSKASSILSDRDVSTVSFWISVCRFFGTYAHRIKL